MLRCCESRSENHDAQQQKMAARTEARKGYPESSAAKREAGRTVERDRAERSGALRVSPIAATLNKGRGLELVRADGDHERKTSMRYVITGPPRCGKTTWVNERAKPGDLVFDMDALSTVMFQLPKYPRPQHATLCLKTVRLAVVRWLQGTTFDADAYVIVADEEQARNVAHAIRGEVVRPKWRAMDDANASVTCERVVT